MNDADEWSSIVDANRSVIWGEVIRSSLLSGLDPEDLCQEVLLALWQSMDRVTASPNPGGLIRVIARRRCINAARSEMRHHGNTDPVGLVVQP